MCEFQYKGRWTCQNIGLRQILASFCKREGRYYMSAWFNLSGRLCNNMAMFMSKGKMVFRVGVLMSKERMVFNAGMFMSI